MVDIFHNFYRGKRVLVTGHTGFKGSWLSIWLHELGAEVIGLALEPTSEKDNYVLSGIGTMITDLRGDIRNGELLKEIFKTYQPDIVFHLAAQPLVRLSYEMPVETYETNVMGTLHVLEAIRATESVKVGVMITTDKCYENAEQLWGYRENEPMGDMILILLQKVVPKLRYLHGDALFLILLITICMVKQSQVFVLGMLLEVGIGRKTG